jgi:DNA topoisomerase VI subunit A
MGRFSLLPYASIALLIALHVYSDTYSKILGDLKLTYHPSILENDLKHTKNNYVIDCEKAGVSIPMVVNKVIEFNTNVESNAMLTILHSAKFHEKYKCIIISGSGMLDVASRKFVNKVSLHLKLPVLVLMDGDIFGFTIMLCYKLVCNPCIARNIEKKESFVNAHDDSFWSLIFFFFIENK